jgi:hypothetical protein
MNLSDLTTKGWTVVGHKPSDKWNWHYEVDDWLALKKAVHAGAITTAQQRCEGGFRLLAKRVSP